MQIRVNVIDPNDLGLIRGAEDLTLGELYQLLDNPRAEHKSAQPLVIGATFTGSRRNKETCVSRNVIPLDLDDGKLTFDQAAEKLVALNLSAVLHTTASHTIQHPKLRAFVLLSRDTTADEWPRAQAWMREVWGSDPQAVDLPRISYAPVPIPEFECELIEGQPLDVDTLPTSTAIVPVRGSQIQESARVEELIKLFGPALPPMGHRHGFYLALIGFCAKQSLPQAEAKALIVQLCAQSGASDKIGERIGLVDVTYAKHLAGSVVAGEQALTDAMGHSVGVGAKAIVLQAARVMLGMPQHQENETRSVDPHDDPPPVPSDEKMKGRPTSRLIFDLDTHPDWAGVLAFDLFSQRRVCLKPAPTSKPLEAESNDWTDNDTTLVQQWLETKLCYTASTDQIEKAIDAVCKRHYVNLVTRWLDSLPEATGAIDSLADTLGLTEAIERKMLRKWLLSAVARAYHPGAFLKSALVMQGEQNAGKTGVLKALFSNSYYVSINSDLTDDKRVAELVQGAWIVELEEGHAVTKTDKAAMKRALSLEKDCFRPAYGRHVVKRPRTCVFAVTTNADEFLDDETGNVRYYCVRVIDHVDLGRVEGLREKVWAEARDAYKAAEPIYLTDRQDQKAAAERAREYEMTDLLDEPIAAFLAGKAEVTTADVNRHVSISHDHAIRAGSGRTDWRIAKILRRLGCVPKRSGTSRVWLVPEKYSKQVPLLRVIK